MKDQFLLCINVLDKMYPDKTMSHDKLSEFKDMWQSVEKRPWIFAEWYMDIRKYSSAVENLV